MREKEQIHDPLNHKERLLLCRTALVTLTILPGSGAEGTGRTLLSFFAKECYKLVSVRLLNRKSCLNQLLLQLLPLKQISLSTQHLAVIPS